MTDIIFIVIKPSSDSSGLMDGSIVILLENQIKVISKSTNGNC